VIRSGSNSPHISICIPAYKRPDKIRRLLRSVKEQVFKNYEVIISDDSPDDSVKNVVREFADLPIIYYKNEKALGTPANWNFSIGKANGEWIKLMHDDDWFVDGNSLGVFAKHAENNKHFIISRYFRVFESGLVEMASFPRLWERKIIRNPVLLLANNVIGPPSVTLIHKSIKERYDTSMKWRVDLDYYITLLKKKKEFSLIDKALVNVGISASQVTNDCINIPEVELPEGLLILKKNGLTPLKNILVYDAWWRIFRNLQVRKMEKVNQYTPGEKWPEVINRMIRHQSYIPVVLLRIGAVSKIVMFISYILNYRYLSS
jgi:glycosyltransferase involved in cell wall biosynthesis